MHLVVPDTAVDSITIWSSPLILSNIWTRYHDVMALSSLLERFVYVERGTHTVTDSLDSFRANMTFLCGICHLNTEPLLHTWSWKLELDNMKMRLIWGYLKSEVGQACLAKTVQYNVGLGIRRHVPDAEQRDWTGKLMMCMFVSDNTSRAKESNSKP